MKDQLNPKFPQMVKLSDQHQQHSDDEWERMGYEQDWLTGVWRPRD